jgi:VIT1/CCC1 family predicted Fe2+/Mn2+ transporter
LSPGRLDTVPGVAATRGDHHAGIEHQHRDVQRGSARAAVFGVSDGLVSNVSLILGVAGADPAPGVVRLAGLAGLIAGAVSMAAGEYVSMRAQTELFERELDIERRELKRSPHAETIELSKIYESRGVQPTRARALAEEMMRDPDLALETHAREELGIDPGQLGSPWSAAISSFIAFTIGALIPLFPWFFATGNAAVVASVILGAIAAVLVGVALARLTGRSPLWSGARQLAITAGAAAVTFAVGRVVGVGVS